MCVPQINFVCTLLHRNNDFPGGLPRIELRDWTQTRKLLAAKVSFPVGDVIVECSWRERMGEKLAVGLVPGWLNRHSR